MQEKGKKRQFVTKKDLILGTIIAIFVSIPFIFSPDRAGRYVADSEIEEFAGQIIPLSIRKIEEDIKDTGGKPTLMVMYASWCGYCKFLLPVISSLKKEGKLEGIRLYFISIDKDKRELAAYLLKHDYNKIFTPQILNRTGEQTLTDLLISKGSNFNGPIPYSIIFNGQGKIVAEYLGLVNKRALLNKIDDVINPPKEN
jgi:thiol-disulfide isomerase/thioredoxin